MKTLKKTLLSFLSLLFLGVASAPTLSWADEELPSREQQLLVQFESTDEESRDVKTFKSQTMQKTILNALDGNPSAIHWVGLSYLTGANGFKQDEKRALGYFSAAAGLGYAPSMDRIKSSYLNSEDPFMALVYIKLMIEQGHSEFLPLYNEYKNVPNLGRIFKEIEKLALQKKEKITQNRKAFADASDKTKFTVDLMTNPGLVSEDKNLSDPEYRMALLAPLKETSKSIADAS